MLMPLCLGSFLLAGALDRVPWPFSGAAPLLPCWVASLGIGVWLIVTISLRSPRLAPKAGLCTLNPQSSTPMGFPRLQNLPNDKCTGARSREPLLCETAPRLRCLLFVTYGGDLQ